MVELYRTADQNFADLTRQTMTILYGLAGDQADGDRKKGDWSDGPKFVWRNLSSPTANDRVKSNPVSRAWKRTAGWLRILKASIGINEARHREQSASGPRRERKDARNAGLASSAKWKLLYYDHQLHVADAELQEEAAAFRAWRTMCSEEVLRTTAWVESLLRVATKAAARTEDQAARAATRRFAEWISGGQANGLRRQHLFSRSTTGWAADSTDDQVSTELSELDDLEGISQEQLRAALAPSNVAGTPVGAQYAANVEKVRWGIQWGSGPTLTSWSGRTTPARSSPCL